jgi:hypothetical protein
VRPAQLSSSVSVEQYNPSRIVVMSIFTLPIYRRRVPVLRQSMQCHDQSQCRCGCSPLFATFCRHPSIKTFRSPKVHLIPQAFALHEHCIESTHLTTSPLPKSLWTNRSFSRDYSSGCDRSRNALLLPRMTSCRNQRRNPRSNTGSPS